MQKNNICIVIKDKALKSLVLLIISVFFVFCGHSRTSIEPVDTLYIYHNIGKVSSFYSADEETQVNTYFSIDSLDRAVLYYCVNSLYPTATFVIENKFSGYFVVDRNKIVVKYAGDNHLYCIDSSSKITGVLEMDLGMENNEPYVLAAMQYAYYIPVAQDSGLLYSSRFLMSYSNYKKDKNIRLRRFSQPLITEFTLNKERLTAYRGIGHYPLSHFSEDSTYNHYWFWTAINKNLDIVTTYFFLDSLYVIHRNNTQSRYPLKSKFQYHVNETIDTGKLSDYVYLAEKSCESTSYMYLRYDAYRDLYYVVVSKAMSYENEDGTHNNAADKPWALIIMDSKFNQKAEIDMPEHLSKHELMIIPEGIAVKDPTRSDNNKSCFIIYNVSL